MKTNSTHVLQYMFITGKYRDNCMIDIKILIGLFRPNSVLIIYMAGKFMICKNGGKHLCARFYQHQPKTPDS